MKRKLTHKSLDELALIMPVLSEDSQRRYVGGGDGSEGNPFTIGEYDGMVSSGTWNGGYVEGWGYTFGDLEVTGSISGSQNGVSGSYDGEWEDWDNDSGSQGGSGYWGDSGNCWGDTGNYFDDGYNTAGGYVNPISSQQIINQIIWESIQSTFMNQASVLYGTDLSKINFKASTERASNAWIGENGEVFLGNSFFNLSSDKQLRVLFHEYFHIEEDKPYSKDPKNIQTTLPEPPSDIKNYIMNVICEGDEFSYQQIMTHNTLRDPQYYINEINAYTKEKDMFANISSEEIAELNYRIWYYTELRKLADQYYSQ